MAVLHLNFGAKMFEIRHCVLEICQIYWGCHNRLVKSWFWEKGSWNLGICTKYWYFGNSEVNFETKTLFLHQILQVTWRLSIEGSKVCEISKSTLRLYLEIFWICIPIIQNVVFRQLVPFDMLSHIYLVVQYLHDFYFVFRSLYDSNNSPSRCVFNPTYKSMFLSCVSCELESKSGHAWTTQSSSCWIRRGHLARLASNIYKVSKFGKQTLVM